MTNPYAYDNLNTYFYASNKLYQGEERVCVISEDEHCTQQAKAENQVAGELKLLSKEESRRAKSIWVLRLASMPIQDL